MTGLSPADGFIGTERFRPLGLVGRGGTGVVYRVYDVETESEVALKTLAAVAPESLYDLKQEFRALADVTHPNLVALYELVVAQEAFFFTMELVDGTDFVTYVRGEAGTATAEGGALARLLRAALQLVDGLSALHRAGKLHRDVKPSNVLVTTSGRVVVLDFGLVAALRGARDRGEASFSGTLQYAGPEQVFGGTRSPASDWYSVGMLVYEALTGRLPFDGPLEEMLVAKRTTRPVPPSALARGIPPELDALVLGLLHPDPAARPPAADIATALCALAEPVRTPTNAPAPRAIAATAPEGFEPTLLGRDDELRAMRGAYEAAGSTAVAAIAVTGPSGIGKSALVRRFLDDVERAPDALVLRGRCQPQELVPYNAFDGVIDGLSSWLAEGPAERIARVLSPAAIDALARIFPVLARSAPFAVARDAPAAEPYETRRRAFEAMRSLLSGIAGERRVVVWIDDAHWADRDSAALLAELVRAPSPPVFFVLSARAGAEADADVDDGLIEAIRAVPDAHRLALGPLDGAAATRLAAELWSSSGAVGAPSAELVREASGSPFMLGQIAFAAGRGGASPQRLADVVSGRIATLPTSARDLLEIVAVAGAPLERDVALDAAGLGRRGRPFAYELQHGRLLRAIRVRDETAVEVYHDRIREAVVAALVGDRRRALHRRLADTLVATRAPDPYLLFTHYLGAGDAERAAHHAEEAADRAAGALAFGRAAELYRRARELSGATGSVRPDVTVKLAHALANAGRSAEAAIEYASAADASETAADAAALFDLRRRSAEQFLRAGRIADGTSGMRAVLARSGIPLAASEGRALVDALALRARLAWRGRRMRRDREPVSESARLHLDALWGATVTLGVMDQVQADALAVRHCIAALDAGDPVHAARAIGLETAKAAQFGGGRQRRRAARMLRLMAELAAEGGEPYERAYLEIVSGVCAYQNARWRDAHERCRAGTAILRESCRGVSWELATSEAFALSALGHMGEFRELAERLPAAIRDAEDRGDLYASVGFRAGILNLLWLARDRPDEARRQADDAIARWPATGAFTVQKYLHLIASVHVDLYVGDPWAAWRRVCDAWPDARRALFLWMEMPRVELRFLRARAALACATWPEPSASDAADAARSTRDALRRAWPSARLVRRAERDARRIAADDGLPSAAPIAALVRAGVATARGRRDDARALLAASRRGFEGVAMGLHAAAARWAEADLLPPPEGERARSLADEWFEAQGVANRAALVAVLAPSSAPATAPRESRRSPSEPAPRAVA